MAISKNKPRHPEKAFAEEIHDALKALGREQWSHNFDDVGQGLSIGSRRPADRVGCFRGRSVLLELKVSRGQTLPYSAIKTHQVKHLLRHHDAGGIGLVLVKQIDIPRPRCWVIPAVLLRVGGLDDGVKGSFALGAPLVEVVRVEDPRGFEGRVWDVRALFDVLIPKNDSEVQNG